MALKRNIAFIDLSKNSIEIVPVPVDLRKKFQGGRGINMYLLSKFYSSDLDPLSAENPLIFGTGLLSGTIGFGSWMNITSKSPESGHLGDSGTLDITVPDQKHYFKYYLKPQCVKVCSPGALQVIK